MLRNIPLIVLFIGAIIILFSKFIPVVVFQNLYAISLAIKSFIIFILPVIIFGLLLKSTINLAEDASLIIGLILGCVVVSSILALICSKFVGQFIYSLNLSIYSPDPNANLAAAWNLEFPNLINNSIAMLMGIVLGISSNWKFFLNYRKLLINFSLKLDHIITKFFKFLIFLIPIFVAGFIAKLEYDGILKLLIKDYSLIFTIIIISQIIYISFAYLILNNFRVNQFLKNLKNMLPAAISGFTTMSSAASMPLTILGVENSLRSKDLARSIIPATVNIHLIGDCFTIPILAYAVLKNYSVGQPLLTDYLLFSFYFILAKFSVAAIPGGGIIVMLPILGNYLKFNSEMMSLIAGLYILFDPINTCINILGNGALAKFLEKCVGCVSKKYSKFNI